jgi:D-methionine transport system ATP-binding protein
MIELIHVDKNYGNLSVLKDVSLTVQDGEIFGIVGQSGAGKSTLLRTINGLEPLSGGQIKVDGIDVSTLKGKSLRFFRQKTAMIFQDFALMETVSVYKNIALPLECAHYSRFRIRERVNELAKMVGIQDKLDSKPHELSGGQKQRVAIARALALNPSVLLSDEATSALDPKTTMSILELLRSINKKLGLTIVIVTHQMEVVKAVCDRVAVIVDGKILQIGKTDEVFLNPYSAISAMIPHEELLPATGINIKLFFPKSFSQQDFITHMARELDIDFSIAWGQLERFKDDVLGELIINISQENYRKVLAYLDKNKLGYEVIEK